MHKLSTQADLMPWAFSTSQPLGDAEKTQQVQNTRYFKGEKNNNNNIYIYTYIPILPIIIIIYQY